MGIIIDLVVVAIFAICILVGYIKGLTGSLLKIISFVLAIVIAFVLFKPVANFVIDHTNWDENLEQAIRQMVLADETEETKEEDKQNQNMPNVIVNYINDQIEKAGDEAKTAIVDATARDVTVTIINAGSWVVLFIVSRIILMFIKGLANLITKLPVIKQFDKLGGIIYGLLEGLVIIYILLAIVSFISPMLSETGIIKGIQDSFVASIFYNNNLLLKLIF